MSLAEIVNDYLKNRAESAEQYLRHYKIQRTLVNAITEAALAKLPSGKRFSHQWRIPKSVLEMAKDALLKSNLDVCYSFDQLYCLVKRTIGPIYGIGELAIYDIAHRLGAYLRLQPEYVYLHAGTRDGAKALKIKNLSEKLSMSEFPPEFQKLRPEQVEDCLCIYKTHLARISFSR
jgi:hypothetical protein